jgi:hypothetical protein
MLLKQANIHHTINTCTCTHSPFPKSAPAPSSMVDLTIVTSRDDAILNFPHPGSLLAPV